MILGGPASSLLKLVVTALWAHHPDPSTRARVERNHVARCLLSMPGPIVTASGRHSLNTPWARGPIINRTLQTWLKSASLHWLISFR